MTDGHPRTDARRQAAIGVDHRAVLHVGVDADVDPVVVTPQHATEPHARAGGEPYGTDHVGRRRKPRKRIDLGRAVGETVEHGDQYERGRPSRCSATYENTKLVEIGAT